MTEPEGDKPEPEGERGEDGAKRKKSVRKKVTEGMRQGIGVLSAFKEALEETIQEARDRGDLSTERAKQVMKTALTKAQKAAGNARERLDFVTQSEFDQLARTVGDLAARVAALEDGPEEPEEAPEG